ncbi:hypothetical protein ACWDR1_24845 [Streptosporangium sandarakinum]
MTIVVVALAPASMILGVMPGMFAVQGARLELRAVHGEGRSGTFTARQLKCSRTGCAWWGPIDLTTERSRRKKPGSTAAMSVSCPQATRCELVTSDFEPELVKAAERIHVSAGEAGLRGSVVQRRGLPDGLGIGTPGPRETSAPTRPPTRGELPPPV